MRYLPDAAFSRCILLVLPLLIHGCGGGNSASSADAIPNEAIVPQSPATGATVISQVELSSGTLSLYSDGTAFLTTNDSTSIRAYSGSPPLQAIAAVPGGVQAQMANGDVFFSPDGLSLGGGGSTVKLPYVHAITTNAQFGPRDSARGIDFAGQLWLSSGYFDLTNGYLDIWYSNDNGANWTLGSGSATPRSTPAPDFYDAYSPIVSDGQNLFAIGSSVWKSADGKAWTKITDAGPERASDDSFGFYRNGLFTYFNTNDGNFFNSSDGLEWSYSPGFLPMKGRCGAVSIVALDKFWLFGGGDCSYGGVVNDIWNSTDGTDWSQALSDNAPKSAEWPARMWPCATTSDAGTIWLFGGYTPVSGENLSDLWYSRDGLSWKQLTVTDASLPSRHAPTCFIRAGSNTLLIVAGKGGPHADNDSASVTNTVTAVDLPIDSFLQ